jgi:hypothetical protein
MLVSGQPHPTYHLRNLISRGLTREHGAWALV